MWEMQQLAHGRVYTGRQAYDIGLVDQLGGLEEAIRWGGGVQGQGQGVGCKGIVAHDV